MFNFSGSEIVFILLLALIILGPEKLPEAMRRFGQTYSEIKKLSSGFQSEFKQAFDEPMREMQATAEELRKAANFSMSAEPPSVADPPAATSPPEQSATTETPELDSGPVDPVEHESAESGSSTVDDTSTGTSPGDDEAGASAT